MIVMISGARREELANTFLCEAALAISGPPTDLDRSDNSISRDCHRCMRTADQGIAGANFGLGPPAPASGNGSGATEGIDAHALSSGACGAAGHTWKAVSLKTSFGLYVFLRSESSIQGRALATADICPVHLGEGSLSS